MVGQGYDVLTDTLLFDSPFLVTGTRASDIGYQIPNTVSAVLTSRTKDSFYWDSTKKEYDHARRRQLGIQDQISADLTGKVHPGVNILQILSNSTAETRKISYLREYRLFQLTLVQNLQLKPEFLNTITKLPDFTDSNETVVEVWKKFFGKYGAFVVSSVYGGGSLEGTLKLLSNETFTSSAEYEKEMPKIFKSLENIQIGKTGFSDTEKPPPNFSLGFLGGDAHFYASDFSTLDLEQSSKILSGFADSLSYLPKLLMTSIELKPISEVVRKSNPGISAKLDRASRALFNSTLVYKPPPTKSPPSPRETVESLAEVEMKKRAAASAKRVSICAQR